MSNNDQTDNIYAGLPSDVVAKLKLAKESAKAAIDSQAKQAADIARRNIEGMKQIQSAEGRVVSIQGENDVDFQMSTVNDPINFDINAIHDSQEVVPNIHPIPLAGLADMPIPPDSDPVITIGSDGRFVISSGVIKHFQELRDSHVREASVHLEEATQKANSAQREFNLREYLNKRILVDAMDYVLSVLKGETKI